MRKRLVALLDELLLTHSPAGLEGEIDADGKIWLEHLSGPKHPVKYGEGPFDLLTPHGVIEGVLCIGSVHVSERSERVHKTRTEVLTWDLVYLDCKLDVKGLSERGAEIGDRILVAKRRKQPLFLQDEYVAGYALDDKGGVAVLLLLAEQLAGSPPKHDVCLAFTTSEEGGGSGIAYLSSELRPQDVVSVEVAPVAEEYPIRMSPSPVVVLKDGLFCYHPALSRQLMEAGRRRGVQCQPALLRGFGSDASISLKAGLTARAACLAFPAENTHGFEIAPLSALENCVEILKAHLGL